MKKELILTVLKDAKKYYEDGRSVGMCRSIKFALFVNGILTDEPIVEYISKYNKKFLNVEDTYGSFWWAPNDRKSRIKAFDKLIDYYSQLTLKERIVNKIKQYGRKCIFWK